MRKYIIVGLILILVFAGILFVKNKIFREKTQGIISKELRGELVSINTEKVKSIKAMLLFDKNPSYTKAPLYIDFDSEINPTVKKRTPYSGTSPIKFTPEIRGKLYWESPKRLVFYPSDDFKPASTYKVEIDKIKVNGKEIRLKEKFLFKTDGLKVITPSVISVNTFFKTAKIKISFNYPVSETALKEAMEIIDSKSEAPLEYTLSSLTEADYFAEIKNLPPYIVSGKIPVIIKIKPTLTVLGGETSLEKPYERSIVIKEGKYFKLVNYRFREEESSFSLSLKFSSELRPQDFSAYFRIYPFIKYTVNVIGDTVVVKSNFQPGQIFKVSILKGLTSKDGALLNKEYNFQVKVPNYSPSLKFMFKGRYIKKSSDPQLKIKSINVKRATIIIKKIEPKNICFWYGKYYKNRWVEDRRADEYVSRKIFEKSIVLSKNKNNKEIITTIGLKDFVRLNEKGVFEIYVFSTDETYEEDQLWINLTNIGLIYKKSKDRVKVWALDLNKLEPVSNVNIKLLSKDSRVLASGQTGPSGSIEFTGITKNTQPFIITGETENDFTYIDSDYSKLDISDFDTGGVSSDFKGKYRAFIYSERDLYRPGEEANIAIIVRDKDYLPPVSLPVILKIMSPQGKIKAKIRMKTDSNGMAETKVKFNYYDKTGIYSANLFLGDNLLGTYKIKVEEFIPQRIRVETELNKKKYDIEENPLLKIKSEYLFGTPLKDGKYKVVAYLKSQKTAFKDFSSYVFGSELKEEKDIKVFEIEDNLDENGIGEQKIILPKGDYSGMMKLFVQTEVFEGESGKSVKKTDTALVSPFKAYIGLKSPAGYLNSGEKVKINGIIINSEGKILKSNKTLKYEIYKRNFSWIYYYSRKDYRYVYKRVFYEDLVNSGSVNTSSGKFSISFVPEWGTYRIRVYGAGFLSPVDLITSTYWWYGEAEEVRNRPAERLNIHLDKEEVKTGEKIKVGFVSPYEGKLLLSIESNELLYYKWYDVKRGEQSFTLKIKNNMYYPTLYVSALIIKKSSKENPFPSRAFGIVPLTIVPDKNEFKLKVKVPEKIKPNSDLIIKLKSSSKKESDVTVAVVDEGILNITGYYAPNPLELFFEKRRAEIFTYDIFGMLLPDLPLLKNSKNGGGYGEEEKRLLNPPVVKRVKPVSLWSGILKIPPKGETEVKFSIPNYQGSLKVMVTGASSEKFASDEKQVIVKDDITIEATLPRFLIKGDELVVPVEIFNNKDKGGYFTISRKMKGLEPIEEGVSKVFIKGNSSSKLSMKYKVTAEDYAVFRLLVSGNGAEVEKKVEIPVNKIMPLVEDSEIFKITEGKEEIPVNFENWQSINKIIVSISNFQYLKELGFVEKLIKYPYGCLEQTTSSVFPLLYIKDILNVVAPKAVKNKNIYTYINAGIEKIISLQTVSGGFAFWPGGTYEAKWASNYALHFLMEAKASGFNVPDFVIDNAARFIKDGIPYKPDYYGGKYYYYKFNRGAYSVYLLTKLKKFSESRLDAYYDKFFRYMSSEGKAFIGGAYLNLGNLEKANSILENIGINSFDSQNYYYSSELRKYGLLLYLLSDTGSKKRFEIMAKVAELLSSDSEYHTTQEIAWAVMGIGKVLNKMKISKTDATLFVNGKSVKKFEGNGGYFVLKGYSGEKIEVKNNGSSPVYTVLKIIGRKPSAGFVPVSNGISIKREYFDYNGVPVEFSSGAYKTNLATALIVKLTISSNIGKVSNFAITDRIPAGFEIENPALEDSLFDTLGLKKSSLTPDYVDIRDDRINIFGSLNKPSAVYYYVIRAVNRGKYNLPPVKAELMYRPKIRTIQDKGYFIVE